MNLFVPADVHKRDLHQMHLLAWKRGVKSLYYCRSLSIQRADAVSEKAVKPAEFTGIALGQDHSAPTQKAPPAKPIDYEECLSCQ